MVEKSAEQNKAAEEMELFQQSIEQYQKGEREKTIPTGHFDNPDFNAAELTKKDKEIWDKIADESLTAEEFAKYRQEVESEEKSNINASERSSRLDFYAFAANKASIVLMKKQLEALKTKK